MRALTSRRNCAVWSFGRRRLNSQTGGTITQERAASNPGHLRAGGAESIAWLVLLVVRGLLLWLTLPLAFLLWLLLTPMRAIFRRSFVSPGKVIGWADLNLIAALGQILIRPFGRPVDFTPWSNMALVDHRVSLVDPW